MKPFSHSPFCCDNRPPKRPEAQSSSANRFLIHRILASGKLQRRCQCYSLALDALPCQGNPPFMVIDAGLGGNPTWQEIPCHERGTMLLNVMLPLAIRIRDSCGNIFTAVSSLEEQISLCIFCPDQQCWRGQISVHAAIRLCSPVPIGHNGSFDARLDVCMEAYLLSSCALRGPESPAYPPSKPWYPTPGFDPWKDCFT